MTGPVSPTSLCPSAAPEWEGSVVFGIIGGTVEEPRLSHLTEPQPVTAELLALAEPVAPAEVFRFAAPCACSGCAHFKDAKCRLVSRVVELLPIVAEKLPPCKIRPECRWWQQEGKAACMRCPQVITSNVAPNELTRLVADPTTPVAAK